MSGLLQNRHKLRRSLTCTLAAAALSGGAIASATSATAAAAPEAGPVGTLGVCGQTFNPVTSGAKAYWQLTCSGGNITMAGWVEDTWSNGRCAKVKAQFPGDNWKFSEPACPKGDREYFNWTMPGSSVNGYLYEYNV